MKVKIVSVPKPESSGKLQIPSRELLKVADGWMFFLVRDTDEEEMAQCHLLRSGKVIELADDWRGAVVAVDNSSNSSHVILVFEKVPSEESLKLNLDAARGVKS